MKLILCRSCSDVVKLSTVFRACACGAIRGRYLEDGWHAEVSPAAIVIGMGNGSIVKALSQPVDPNAEEGPRIEAWLMGPKASRVRRLRS